MMALSFLDEITTQSKVVKKHFESNMAVGISKLDNLTQATVECNITV